MLTKVSLSVAAAGHSPLASGRLLPSWWLESGWQGGERECSIQNPLVFGLYLFFIPLSFLCGSPRQHFVIIKKAHMLHWLCVLCRSVSVISAQSQSVFWGRVCPRAVLIFLMPGQGHQFINFGDKCSSEFQHFRGFAFANIQAGVCVQTLVACSETWH